jgi:hypothetical protein
MSKTYKTMLEILDNEMREYDRCLYKNILRDIRFRMQIEETCTEAVMCFARQIERNIAEQHGNSTAEKLEDLYIRVLATISYMI